MAADIVSCLRSEAVRFVLPRNFDLPGRLSGDLDIWVHPDDLKMARDLVLSTATEDGWRLISRWELPRHFQYGFYREGKGDTDPIGLAIDLEAEVGMKGFRYAPIGPFLENRREQGSLPRPQIEAEAVALALHVVLSKEAVSPEYRERLQAYDPEGFRAFANRILTDSVSSDLTDWLASGAQDKGIEELAANLRRKLTLTRPGNLLRRAYVRLHAWSRFLTSRKGLLVALVGPDGGGKSTISSLARRRLLLLPTPVSSVYMGKKDTVLPTSRFIRWLSTRFGDRSVVPGPPPTGSQSTDTKTGGDADGAVSPVARIADTLGLLNWLLEQWYRYVSEIRPVLQQEGVVLTDRYFVDFVQRPDFSLAHRGLVRRLLIRLFPEPDIAVLLSAEPEVLQQRKPEHDPEQCAVNLSRFRAALETYSRSIEIRTDTGTASGNASNVVNKILASMAERHDD